MRVIKPALKVAIVYWLDSSHYSQTYAAKDNDFPLIGIISVGLYHGENKEKDSVLLTNWYVPAGDKECGCKAEIKRVEAIPKKLIKKIIIKDIVF